MFVHQSIPDSLAGILPRNQVRSATHPFDTRKAVVSLVLALIVILSFGGTSKASASVNGVAVTSVNLRAGPSTQYPVVRVMPQSASLVVYGCSGDRSWCDVSWAGARGWVSASYIYVNYNGRQTVLTASIAPVIGIATVAFSVAYWDSHYHSQPWHGHWNRYYHGGGSRKAVAGCGPNGCGAAVFTRGPNGGVRAAAGGCNDGNCGGAAVTRGPNGGGRAAVGGCGPEKCGGASVTRGPLGNTRVRHGSFDRP